MSVEHGHPRVVVFDFDGTLFDGDLGYEWLRWLLLRSPWRLALLLLSTPLWLPLLLLPNGFSAVAAYCFRLATLGAPHTDCGKFLDARGAELRQRLFPQALAALAAHQAAGERVVIATAELPALVHGLLTELPHACPPVLGSQFERGRWTLRLRLHLLGARKLDALDAAGYGRHFALSYTDSLRDTPLILSSDCAVLVNFAHARRARIERRLAALGAATRLDWRDWGC